MAADILRANSNYASNEYCLPVMGRCSCAIPQPLPVALLEPILPRATAFVWHFRRRSCWRQRKGGGLRPFPLFLLPEL